MQDDHIATDKEIADFVRKAMRMDSFKATHLYLSTTNWLRRVARPDEGPVPSIRVFPSPVRRATVEEITLAAKHGNIFGCGKALGIVACKKPVVALKHIQGDKYGVCIDHASRTGDAWLYDPDEDK